MNHEELRTKALNRKDVREEFDNLMVEYSLLKRMLSACQKAGLTQAQVALRMGTKAPAIVRLERSLRRWLSFHSCQFIANNVSGTPEVAAY
jgi:hypothetical protein